MTRQADLPRGARAPRGRRRAHPFPAGRPRAQPGVQDAVNLGWKLAAVIKGSLPDTLLDTYHAERHPVAARVLHNTMAQIPLTEAGPRTDALRDIVADLLGMDEPRKRIAGMMSGLDIHYDVGEGQPTARAAHAGPGRGNRRRPTRVYRLPARRAARAAQPRRVRWLVSRRWADRVQLADATYAGAWDLPVLGEVTAPAAVLVRPDGYVAWVGDVPDPASRTRSPAGSARPPRRSQASSVMRSRTRRAISSRMGRTSSRLSPAGSGGSSRGSACRGRRGRRHRSPS